MPDELSSCHGLIELYLGQNKLKTLTETIGIKFYVFKLHLCGHVGSLTQLAVLDLSSNELKTLPRNPWKNLNLQTLDLSNNNLSGLPGEIGLVTTLRRIALEGNPLRTVRRELITGPVSRLLDSLRKKLPVEETKNDIPYSSGRIIITGDPLKRMKNYLKGYVVNQSPGELDFSKMGLQEVPEDFRADIEYVSKLILSENNVQNTALLPLSQQRVSVVVVV